MKHAQPVAAAPAAGEAQILEEALAAFAEKGFHGASMREIAARAGASVSHAYYYFPSKQAILFRIVHDITAELAQALAAAADAAGDDPADRLRRIVRAYVLLHTRRQRESFVSTSELRSLAPEERAAVIDVRDAVSRTIKDAIAAGRAGGAFDCPEPAETAIAIATMCSAVARWHRPDGPLGPDELADRYAAIALRMAGRRGGA